MHTHFLAAAAIIAGTLVTASTAPGAPAHAPAAQAAPAQNAAAATSGVVLRLNGKLVLVDVAVTEHGKPVQGLDRSRFHVFEDGREQRIGAFDEHRAPTAPPNASALAAQLAGLAPHTYTNIPVYPDSGAVNVLLLDALNTPMADQAEVRLQMIDYLGEIKPGTSLAIFTLASRLQMVEGFTANAALLAKVMKGKATSSSHSVVLEDQNNSTQMEMEEMLANMEQATTPPSPEVVGELMQFENDLTAMQTNLRVQVTLDALQELARYLSGIPGRKNLIWFSGSFPITIDPEDTARSPFRNVQDYGDLIRKTTALLAAARVAVYPVDARGLMGQNTVDAQYTPSPNGMSVNGQGKLVVGQKAQNIGADYTKFLTQTDEEHESMETVAEQTGGKAFVNTNDLKDAVADVTENGSAYYSIAYVPSGEKADGSFRTIKVSVDKGSYKLAYRDGYYADELKDGSTQGDAGANLIASAILHGAPPATEIALKARVLPASDPLLKNVKLPVGLAGRMAATMKGPLRRYVVDLGVDPRDFAFDTTPDGARHARLEFVLVDYGADGNRVNYLDQALNVSFTPQQYGDAMSNGLHARMQLDLPAAHSSLRVAVEDLNAGRAGSLEVDIGAAHP
ncbi:MAG: VWA domain-containing protein [Terracidiphilus sp.]